MNFETLDKTIKQLKQVITDENCEKMNLSNIKGYLGELLVIKKLAENTANIIQKGNQSGYDIELPDQNIQIDVKYSTIKSEVKNCPPYWGWALKHQNKTKPISCSHFLCVAANQNYDPEDYYVIKSRNLDLFPESAIRQFKNVERGLCLLTNRSSISEFNDDKLKIYFQTCVELLDKKLIVKVPNDDDLMDALLN